MRSNYHIYAIAADASESGKSTARDILLDLLKPGAAHHISIAEPIRKIAYDMFGWDGDKTVYRLPDDPKDPGTPFNQIDPSRGRGLLISIGMLMRMQHPTVWVDKAISKIQHERDSLLRFCAMSRQEPPMQVFIIDDLRWFNETEKLREVFGYNVTFIKIVNRRATKLDHVSERGLESFEDFQYEIPNEGSVDDLRQHLLEILAETIHP